jgi:hypothetical protein
MTRASISIARLNPIRAARRPVGDDEGIALLLVVMAVLIVASLSVLALGAIVVQTKPTQFERKSTQTLSAAEAGLDAGLAAIRNATYVEGVDTFGDRAQLPCWSPFSGKIGDPSGVQLTYSVTIQYFKTDPSIQTATWRTANAMPCGIGIGTSTTPAYAFISSAGTGAALPRQAAAVGNRTLQSVYTFKSTNPNLPGGLIKDSSGLCYAGVATVGGAVSMATCLAGAATEMWAYTVNYQIVLTSTRAADGTGGLCLSGVLVVPATKVNATMQTCDPSALDYSQKWGVSNSDPVTFFGHLNASQAGVTPAQGFSSQYCLGAVVAGVAGSLLTAGGNCTGVYPQAQVGAGAAGTSLLTPADVSGKPFQWVNYQEFGRCLDVTGWNVSTPSQILYPCKQDPMAGAVLAASPGWNEVFVWDLTSKHFMVYKDASSNTPYLSTNPSYCLQSPNTNGGYVLFGTLCSSIPAGSSAAYTWTLNRANADAKTSYTIVDSYGRCLAGGTPNGSNASAYSSVVTATCDGSGSQKWNAPANLGSASVGDTAEVLNH